MIERIIRDHIPGVRRFAFSRLRTPDRAEDALDCCSKAACITCEKYSLGLITPQDDEKKLVGFFYGTARNVVLEKNASFYRRSRLIEENIHRIRENLHFDDKRLREVVETIERLFELLRRHLAQRELRILELHYREGRSFEEIAEILGLRAPNVRKIHQRTVEKVRVLVSRYSGPDDPDGPNGGGAGPGDESRGSGSDTRPVRREIHVEYEGQNKDELNLPGAEQVIQLLINYGKFCNLLKISMLTPIEENIDISAISVEKQNREMSTSLKELGNIFNNLRSIIGVLVPQKDGYPPGRHN